MVLAELAEKSSVLVGQKIVKSETGADKHFFDAGQGAELSKERKVVAVVHLEIGAGLGIEAAAVLAGALCQLLVAGGAAEFRSGAADVVDVALEIRVFETGLSFGQDGLVASRLHDAPLVEGQRAEIAVAKTSPVGSQTELDLGERRDSAVLLIGGVVGAHERQRIDIVHLLHSQGLGGRILHNKELAVVGLI